MSSPNGFYRRADDLRLRPVPEMGFCLVFAPSVPQLYTLNTTAWLVLELCDGADQDSIVRGYYHEIEPLLTLVQAGEQVTAALDDLIATKLVMVEAGRAS